MSWIVWLSIMVFLVVVEIFTIDLVSIWCALSALVMTIITAIFPEIAVIWQICIFLALSAILLLSTRKFVKKLMKGKGNKETNLGLIINHTALVVEDIENDLEKGAVKINGIVWSARSLSGQKVNSGELVRVEKINGNKLIVEIKE